jgi:hypothetical protein
VVATRARKQEALKCELEGKLLSPPRLFYFLFFSLLRRRLQRHHHRAVIVLFSCFAGAKNDDEQLHCLLSFLCGLAANIITMRNNNDEQLHCSSLFFSMVMQE